MEYAKTLNTCSSLNFNSFTTEGQVQRCSKSFGDVEYYKRVFVLAQADDTHTYHIQFEVMPRIYQHLEFLQSNSDIKILIGCDSKNDAYSTKKGLQYMMRTLKRFFRQVGIDIERLVVHKNVYAEQVYFPSSAACQDPVYNTWSLLKMREYTLESLKARKRYVSEDNRRMILLLARMNAEAKNFTRNAGRERTWEVGFLTEIKREIERNLPGYRVEVFDDSNVKLMKCNACQLRLFQEAYVLVGIHGAGLGNSLFMQPNRAVVEITPYGNDGRTIIGGGLFSRMAAVMSHSYMVIYKFISIYFLSP